MGSDSIDSHEQKPIKRRMIGRASPRTMNDQEHLHERAVSYNGPRTSFWIDYPGRLPGSIIQWKVIPETVPGFTFLS